MSQSNNNAGFKKRPRPTRGDFMLRIAGAVALAGIIVVLALSIPSSGRTLALATTKQPERFTELYFSDHLHLPKQVVARRAATVTYHITNHEAAVTAYRPRVTIFESGKGRVLSQTAVILGDGEGQDITVSFVPTRANSELELVIDLPDQHQSIHFRSHS